MELFSLKNASTVLLNKHEPRFFLLTKASTIISKLSQFGKVTSARFNALLTLMFLLLHVPENLGEY